MELDLKASKIRLGVKVDLNFLENYIAKRHDAIFVATDLNRPQAIIFESVRLNDVYEASDFLNRAKKRPCERQ
jgi:NADPH-dependent glutamate synthase beta subunit-like oxidoreductase